MRVAVTGASGFCGRAVATALREAGHEVVSVGRSNPGVQGVSHISWSAGEGVPQIEVDRVVHLAARVGDRGTRQEFAQVNVIGTREVLATGVPAVVVSTASVYVGGEHPRREAEAQMRSEYSYAASKFTAEQEALRHGAVVLRPRAVYGPGDPYLEPRILAALRGRTMLLPGVDRPLSLTHVGNLAAAVCAALDWENGAYNIADARLYQRDAAVKELLAKHGIDARLVHLPPRLLHGVAGLAECLASSPLSRYAVEQLADPVVLDLTRAYSAGYRPQLDLYDHLARQNT